MTKEEIRAIALSKLRMEDGLVCVDVGAGTGSLTVEMGLQTPSGHVYGIEVNEEAVGLIENNVGKFGLQNVTVIHGRAPEDLKVPGKVDRVVVGGSKGNLEAIVRWTAENMKEDGIAVGNFIVLENAVAFIQNLKKEGFSCEVVQVSLAKGRPVGSVTMMEANNPIFVVTGKKTGREETQ